MSSRLVIAIVAGSFSVIGIIVLARRQLRAQANATEQRRVDVSELAQKVYTEKDARTMAEAKAIGPTGRKETLGIEIHYRAMQESCRQILEETLKSPHKELLASSHDFISDLSNWDRILDARPEWYLISTATAEYQHALLTLAQGQYRQAFKSLRLVLELTIQAIYLSVHILELQEWLDGSRDTNWGMLIDENQPSAVLTSRYAKILFPELETHIPHYRSMAKELYRECSECVHGNVPKNISLPEAGKLKFDDQALKLWCKKANTAALLVSFLLTLRYTKEFSEQQIANISDTVLDRLGHINAIRVRYGGVST